jgi:RecG-like helicase
MGGKQVALLVPTTLLAEQHFQNFSDRFNDWPIKIAELSRFRSAKESKAALAGLAEGTVDIVIGTHKLVQPDVQFKNLGLVIIDEEHRFGVRQKSSSSACAPMWTCSPSPPRRFRARCRWRWKACATSPSSPPRPTAGWR